MPRVKSDGPIRPFVPAGADGASAMHCCDVSISTHQECEHLVISACSHDRGEYNRNVGMEIALAPCEAGDAARLQRLFSSGSQRRRMSVQEEPRLKDQFVRTCSL